jgi:hypothetical protein
VIVVASIAREKVALTGGPWVVPAATPVAASAGFWVVTVGDVPIVHVTLAGVASTFPAASVALTVNVWLPTVRPVYGCGLVHALKAALSSEQAYVAPFGLSDVKLNDALVAVVGEAGLAVMIVSGGVVSTVQV